MGDHRRTIRYTTSANGGTYAGQYPCDGLSRKPGTHTNTITIRDRVEKKRFFRCRWTIVAVFDLVGSKRCGL